MHSLRIYIAIVLTHIWPLCITTYIILPSMGLYRYLRQVGTSKASGRKNPALVEKFEEVERAFTLFGFSAVVSNDRRRRRGRKRRDKGGDMIQREMYRVKWGLSSCYSCRVRVPLLYMYCGQYIWHTHDKASTCCSSIGYQEFHQVCQVLSTVLCIGDIKIEEDVSNYHLGEISAIANPLHVMVGKWQMPYAGLVCNTHYTTVIIILHCLFIVCSSFA